MVKKEEGEFKIGYFDVEDINENYFKRERRFEVLDCFIWKMTFPIRSEYGIRPNLWLLMLFSWLPTTFRVLVSG